MTKLTKGQISGRVAVRVIAAAALSGVLAACSGVEPFDYTAIHEIQPGPGLFSGEDGAFVYTTDRNKKKTEETD